MSDTRFLSAIPVLASLDIQRSVDFFAAVLGFAVRHSEPGVYGMVIRGEMGVDFPGCHRARGCRIPAFLRAGLPLVTFAEGADDLGRAGSCMPCEGSPYRGR